MAAAHNKFTEEQMEQLRGNKYVRSVGRMFVYFTDDFKRLYWHMYTVEKLLPHEILPKLGIDYHLLGTARVRGFTHNLKKQFARDGGFYSDRKDKQPERQPKQTSEQKLERLRAENEYLKQELEFVKKIVAAGGGVKR